MAHSGQTYPVGGYIPVQYHHQMLADEARSAGFQRAIDRIVRPGNVVLDAGAGTGLLSFFAARRGARVYAIEADPAVAALAGRLIALNGLNDRITLVQARAEEYTPPEPVDVVICEMLHVGLLVEQQVPVLNAIHSRLRERFPGHSYRVIPAEALTYCQLAAASFTFHGYYAPFPRLTNPYQADSSVTPLSELVPLWHVELGEPIDPTVSATISIVPTVDGELNALRMLTQVVIDWAHGLPDAAGLVQWHLNWLTLPLPAPVSVEAGRPVAIAIEYQPGADLAGIRLAVQAG